ncbi:hypothetical protein KY342_05775 [Candidatus Woesearchaeota archaeon]|nr:hypothetical protein [Candidatus Woesearchaeota archaeon]
MTKRWILLLISFIFITGIMIYSIIEGINTQKPNEITGSFVKVPLQTKLYIIPWILLFLLIIINFYICRKKKDECS